MEHVIHSAASSHPGRDVAGRVLARVAFALRRALLVSLQAMLGTFVAGYPLLRLGFLGPVPEGYTLEAALGVVAGALAAVLFVLEGWRET